MLDLKKIFFLKSSGFDFLSSGRGALSTTICFGPIPSAPDDSLGIINVQLFDSNCDCVLLSISFDSAICL